MGQIQFTVSLVLIALFAIGIIGFATHFADDNNTGVDISDDSIVSGVNTDLNNNLSSFKGGSQSTYQSIVESSVESGSDTTVSGGPFVLTPLSLLGTIQTILKVGFNKIFGADSGFGIFFTTFIALLGFIAIMYAWKTWIGRIPD